MPAFVLVAYADHEDLASVDTERAKVLDDGRLAPSDRLSVLDLVERRSRVRPPVHERLRAHTATLPQHPDATLPPSHGGG